MSNTIITAMIHMVTLDAITITTEEFEQLEREVKSRILANVSGISDRICLRLLDEHRGRYYEAQDINNHQGTKGS